MRISQEQSNKKRRAPKVLLFCIALIVLAASFALHFHKQIGFSAHIQTIKQSIQSLSMTSTHIALDIGHIEFQKLAHKRQQALDRGLLITTDDDEVPAKLRIGEESTDVKIRLKGDWLDHLDDKKWSFRVKVKGDNAFLGMKTFSLQHPRTRNYIYEWMHHELLKREGVLAPRYGFIELSINGESWGVYAIEEHMAKELVEHNKRREGPIIKFNEDLLWAERNRFGGKQAHSGSGLFSASPITAFKEKKIAENENLSAMRTNAVQLLEAFRSGEKKTTEVFDTEKMATFVTVMDLMGSTHGIVWHNLRFYYNPITTKLEPIGFDNDSGNALPEIAANRSGHITARLFNDQAFFAAYTKKLKAVSEKAYLDQFFADTDEALQNNLSMLHKSFPAQTVDKERFYDNQAYIKKILRPSDAVHAYLHAETADTVTLSLTNTQLLPIVINGIKWNGVRFTPTEQTTLSPKNPSHTPHYTQVVFNKSDVSAADVQKNGELVFHVIGQEKELNTKINGWTPVTTEGQIIPPAQYPNSASFGFIKKNEHEKTMTIERGEWYVRRNLVIPAGYTVQIKAGAIINIENNATIISYSPLHAEGTEKEPIVIRSLSRAGQGIVVMNTKERSKWQHVNISNQNAPNQYGWKLTGGITFYNAPVLLEYVQIKDNPSGDDAINIIQSDFTLNDLTITNSLADAIDIDFSDGLIQNLTVVNAGNDALDISGSHVTLDGLRVDGAGDKGISAGEQSTLFGKTIAMHNVVFGIVSKDNSKVHASNIAISDAETGFSAYQKKAEYGPGEILIDGELSIEHTKKAHLIEKGSLLRLQTKEIKGQEKNLAKEIYEE